MQEGTFLPTLLRFPPHPPTHAQVVFGEVTKGSEIVKKIESYGSDSGRCSKTITITNSGQL